LAVGSFAGDRDLVFLPILLFCVLCNRALRRSGLSVLGALVVFRIFNFETEALANGFFAYFGCYRMLLREVEFHAEVAAIAPTAVKLESAALIIHEGKAQTFVSADGPIPTAIRICNLIGKTSDAGKWLVTDADDVMVEVVKRVAHVPHEFAATFALAIGSWREWIVGIFEPPDGI
jgi:hypothetical protein